MTQIRYYLGFNLVPGIGPARLSRLIEYFGSVQAAWEASLPELMRCGLEGKLCEALIAARRSVDLDRLLEQAASQDVTLLCVEDQEYPERLRRTPAPPPLIYLRGSFTPADEWAVAIVGTRNITNYGRDAAYELARGLAEAGVTIISGLALGVDAVAHQAALDAGGRTIAVLGSGVDKPYPERNRTLARRMLTQGALISDYPLGTAPAPLNFPPRNRLISGLAAGVVVVEAGEKSGALITVNFALEQGREVFAVPGPVFSRASVGPHQLIRDGATLVTSAQDVLETLGWHHAASISAISADEPLPDDPQEAALLEHVGLEPQHVDVLVRSSGLPAPTVSAVLSMLELKGFVRQTSAMQFVRARR